MVSGRAKLSRRGLSSSADFRALRILLALTLVLTLISVRVFRWDEI